MLCDTLDHSDDIGLILRQSGGDAADRRIAANDAYCRATGRTHEELVGRAFQEFVAHEGSNPLERNLTQHTRDSFFPIRGFGQPQDADRLGLVWNAGDARP